MVQTALCNRGQTGAQASQIRAAYVVPNQEPVLSQGNLSASKVVGPRLPMRVCVRCRDYGGVDRIWANHVASSLTSELETRRRRRKKAIPLYVAILQHKTTGDDPDALVLPGPLCLSEAVAGCVKLCRCAGLRELSRADACSA